MVSLTVCSRIFPSQASDMRFLAHISYILITRTNIAYQIVLQVNA